MSKAIVLYNSRGGNTKEVAMKIAEGLEAECKDFKHIPDLKEYDLLVLGTWPIMGGISPAGKRLIRRVRRKDLAGKKIALFITSGGPDEVHPSTKEDPNPKTIQEVIFEHMEERLGDKGTILDDRFYCMGTLRMMGKEMDPIGHPNEEELREAKAFGEKLKKEHA